MNLVNSPIIYQYANLATIIITNKEKSKYNVDKKINRL